jgi:hypothetical protein
MSRSLMGTFESAFCEFDREKLLERIGLVKAAIDAWLKKLDGNSCLGILDGGEIVAAIRHR